MAEQQNTRSSYRLKILTEEELADIYGLPLFDEEERDYYFTLTSEQEQIMETLRGLKSQVFFCLQLAYFKAKQRFFVFGLSDATDDFQYLLDRYFKEQVLDSSLSISKRTRLKQQQLILELSHYKACLEEERTLLKEKAKGLARLSVQPSYLFRELMHFLETQGICLPAYSSMQKIIAKALNVEQNRLSKRIQAALLKEDRKNLNALLDNPNWLYTLTFLKRQPKDFSLSEIKQELKRSHQLKKLYPKAKALLEKLKLPAETIKYYASLASYYSVYKLKRFKAGVSRLYLLCFVYHRYQRLNDNLINSLLHNVRRFNDEAKVAAEAKVYAYKIKGNQNLPKAGRILQLFTDPDIEDTTPFYQVKEQAYKILEAEQIDHVASHISTKARFDEKAFVWEHIDTLERQFKLHLRPLVMAIYFEASSVHHPLLEALTFLKAVFQKPKPLAHYAEASFPLGFVSKKQRHYLYREQEGKKKLLADRYEYLVYRQLRIKIDALEVSCKESTRFRSFKDDLIDDETWEHKDSLLFETGLGHLAEPIEDQLAKLEQLLETRLLEVNKRLETGDNPFVQLKHQGQEQRWTFQQASAKEEVNHPFFKQLKQLDMSTVMHFVNDHCQFFKAFDHLLGRFQKTIAKDHALVAALTAWGSNMGLGRMSGISDISYQELVTTSQNFLRSETLKEANDLISNAIKALPIFEYFSLDNQLHSSSDGQKFETRLHTIRSRYSPKYFGLKKALLITQPTPITFP